MGHAKKTSTGIEIGVQLESTSLRKSESNRLTDKDFPKTGELTIEVAININTPSDDKSFNQFEVFLEINATGMSKAEDDHEPEALFTIKSEYIGTFNSASPITTKDIIKNPKPYIDQVYPLTAQHCQDLAGRMNFSHFKIPASLPSSFQSD